MPGRLRDPGPSARLPALDALRSDDVAPVPSSLPDEGWTVAELRSRAAELGISGRSTMRKVELLEALRSR